MYPKKASEVTVSARGRVSALEAMSRILAMGSDLLKNYFVVGRWGRGSVRVNAGDQFRLL